MFIIYFQELRNTHCHCLRILYSVTHALKEHLDSNQTGAWSLSLQSVRPVLRTGALSRQAVPPKARNWRLSGGETEAPHIQRRLGANGCHERQYELRQGAR